MTEQHLIDAVSQRFKALSRRQRIRQIRKLAGESKADERFIRKTFPDLYEEAFQKPRNRSTGLRSLSARSQRGRPNRG